MAAVSAPTVVGPSPSGGSEISVPGLIYFVVQSVEHLMLQNWMPIVSGPCTGVMKMTPAKDLQIAFDIQNTCKGWSQGPITLLVNISCAEIPITCRFWASECQRLWTHSEDCHQIGYRERLRGHRDAVVSPVSEGQRT